MVAHPTSESSGFWLGGSESVRKRGCGRPLPGLGTLTMQGWYKAEAAFCSSEWAGSPSCSYSAVTPGSLGRGWEDRCWTEPWGHPPPGLQPTWVLYAASSRHFFQPHAGSPMLAYILALQVQKLSTRQPPSSSIPLPSTTNSPEPKVGKLRLRKQPWPELPLPLKAGCVSLVT